VETLMTAQPIDVLLYQKVSEREEGQPFVRGVLSAVFLQVVWAFRALLTPSLVGLGTALALAGSNDALDVVMNSVAAGFILEVDEYIFNALIGADEVSAFEERPQDNPSHPTKPILAMRHRLQLVPLYSWLIYIVNTTLIFFLFGQRILDQFVPFSIFSRVPDSLALLIFLRSVIFAVMHLHVALAVKTPLSTLLTHTIPSCLITALACPYLAWFIYKSVLQPWFGWGFYQEPNSELMACLQAFTRSPGCIFDENGNMARLSGRNMTPRDSLQMRSYAYGNAVDRYGSQYENYHYAPP